MKRRNSPPPFLSELEQYKLLMVKNLYWFKQLECRKNSSDQNHTENKFNYISFELFYVFFMLILACWMRQLWFLCCVSLMCWFDHRDWKKPIRINWHVIITRWLQCSGVNIIKPASVLIQKQTHSDLSTEKLTVLSVMTADQLPHRDDGAAAHKRKSKEGTMKCTANTSKNTKLS